MNEKDIYLKLLDEKEIDNVLKMFNLNPKNMNLQLKMFNMNKLLKGRKKVEINKEKENAFYAIIQTYKIQDLDKLNERQFFKYLEGHDENDELKDYHKFANALIYYPDTTKKLLKNIEKNIENKKPIFHKLMRLESAEETKDYVLKTIKLDDGKSIVNTLAYISQYINIEKFKKTKDIDEKVKNWTLRDFVEKIDSLDDESLIIYKYSYLKTHLTEDYEVKITLLIDLITDMLNDNVSCEKFEELKNELETYKCKIDEFKEKEKELKKEKRQIKKENKILLKDNEELIIKLNEENDKYNHEYTKIQTENEKLREQLNEINSYKCALNGFEDELDKKIAIIGTLNFKMAKTIFPQIKFIESFNYKDEMKVQSLDEIDYILIHRTGVSSKDIFRIENFADQNNKKTIIFLAFNEKQAIEQISILKSKIREEF